MRHTIGHWIPAVFCAFISLIALVGSIDSDATWWRPTFFAFLPLSFFFVGAATLRMQREISELQRQVSEMQEKKVGWRWPVEQTFLEHPAGYTDTTTPASPAPYLHA